MIGGSQKLQMQVIILVYYGRSLAERGPAARSIKCRCLIAGRSSHAFKPAHKTAVLIERLLRPTEKFGKKKDSMAVHMLCVYTNSLCVCTIAGALYQQIKAN